MPTLPAVNDKFDPLIFHWLGAVLVIVFPVTSMPVPAVKVACGSVTELPLLIDKLFPFTDKVCASVDCGSVTEFPLLIDKLFPFNVKVCASLSVEFMVKFG